MLYYLQKIYKYYQMSDPTIIANLLQETLTGTTQSIKQAEITLQKLQADSTFLLNLFLVVNQQSIARNLRKAAAIYTKKFVKNRIIQKDEQRLKLTAQQLINQLSRSSLDLRLNRYIASSFELLLMNDQKFIIREKLNPLCLKLLEQVKNNDGPNPEFEFIGFLVQGLMNSFIHISKQMNAFIQNSIWNFCIINNKLFHIIESFLESADKQKILKMFELLKLYSHTFKHYMKKMLLAQLQTVRLLYNDNLYTLVSTALNFIPKGNGLSTTVVYYNKTADSQIIELFHSIKADYVQGIGSIMRAVFIQFKDRQMISANAILNNPALIPSLIKNLNDLLEKVPYYKMKSPSLVKLIEEILALLILAVRNNFYFDIFMQYKQPVIHGCIMKILAFSVIDCQVFYEEPDEFINQLLQIIEMDSSSYLKSKDKQPLYYEGNDQIQEYSNMRTLASTLLEAFCKNIDGSLPEIIKFSTAVLTNQINSDIPKSMLLLMLCILRDQIINRQNQNLSVISIVRSLLVSKKIPIKVNDPESTPAHVYEENIEYLVILLTVYRYLSLVKEVQASQIVTLQDVIYRIIVSEDISEALQFESYDLIVSVCERSNENELKFIQLLNTRILNNKGNMEKNLQTLCNLFSNPSDNLQNNLEVVIQTVQNMANTVYAELTKKEGFKQIIINKCWNLITGISQDNKFIPKLIPHIEEAIKPLVKFIDGQNNFDFEQDILMMMSSFIQKSKCVTQNQLEMFQIIPKLFYSQYEFRFGHAFETLQIFIFHGRSILAADTEAIKAIIQMAVCNMNTLKIKDIQRNEGQNCEGVILIQSLIMSCSYLFSPEIWVQVAKAINKRLENPPVKSHILRSNLIGTLSLILTQGYSNFSNEDCDTLLSLVLQNYYCFVVQYSIKIAIVTFSKLLTLYNLPFVASKYTLLFDATITLLESFEKKGIFTKTPLTDQQRDYEILKQTTKNMIVQIDEVDYFKKRVLQIRQQNNGLLQKTIAQLPEKKVEYLKKAVNTTKVNNESRIYYKIKQ